MDSIYPVYPGGRIGAPGQGESSKNKKSQDDKYAYYKSMGVPIEKGLNNKEIADLPVGSEITVYTKKTLGNGFNKFDMKKVYFTPSGETVGHDEWQTTSSGYGWSSVKADMTSISDAFFDGKTVVTRKESSREKYNSKNSRSNTSRTYDRYSTMSVPRIKETIKNLEKGASIVGTSQDTAKQLAELRAELNRRERK